MLVSARLKLANRLFCSGTRRLGVCLQLRSSSSWMETVRVGDDSAADPLVDDSRAARRDARASRRDDEPTALRSILSTGCLRGICS